MEKENNQQFSSENYLILTGFGSFNKIKQNPSSLIEQEIKEKIIKNKKTFNFELLTSKTLEVIDSTVIEELKILSEKISKIKEKNSEAKFLIIHLGVRSQLQEKEIHLERCCYNSKNFKNGNKKILNFSEKIQEEITHEAKFTTTLNLENVVKEFQEEYNFLKISEDPGRYLCNFI